MIWPLLSDSSEVLSSETMDTELVVKAWSWKNRADAMKPTLLCTSTRRSLIIFGLSDDSAKQNDVGEGF